MSLVSCTELLLGFFLLLEGCAKPPDKYVEAYQMFAKYNGGKDSTAITRNQPAVGHSMNCIKVEYFDGKYKATPWTTSMVVKSEEIAEGVFKVITTNNVYMTMLVR